MFWQVTMQGSQDVVFCAYTAPTRHDLKIYASDEGRVQMTAAAFAKVCSQFLSRHSILFISSFHCPGSDHCFIVFRLF